MNRIQNLLVLACLGGTVFGGLLPGGGGGGNGYQYDRPGAFGGPGTGVGFGGALRPSSGYGAPGGFAGNGGFGQRPSGNYGAPGFGGNGGFHGGNGGYNNYNEENARPKPYSFQYEVRDPPSGNDYAQQESSDGNTVRGEYRVLLPDSRTQIVRYTADDASGYNAEVQYEGQAQYPQAGGYQGGYDFQGGQHRGGGGGSGFGSGGSPNNQYLPAGVDYGK